MDLKNIVSEIKSFISKATGKSDLKSDLNDQDSLLGGGSSIDSLQLVELCLFLEEKAEEKGFIFDWTSEKAMSRTNSMFKSILSLAEEFKKQYENIKK
jgi:acyl carrier protein